MNLLEEKVQNIEVKVATHEAVCAERYREMMNMMQQNSKDIESLKTMLTMGHGAWKLIVILGSIVGFVLMIKSYVWK